MIQYEIIKILKQGLQKNKEIKSAILYGSFARRDESANSDIDLAILVEKDFENTNLIQELNSLLSQFDLLHIFHVKLRNKTAVYFKEIPKVEITTLTKIEDFQRNYHGSNIPADLINTTILFDKTNTVNDFLQHLSGDSDNINKKQIVSDLIDKFVYEFESCSYNHSRSDAYKFYFFYNIAFHTAIQLKYLSSGKTNFYFLPKNFAVKNFTNKEQREEFYQLSGSTYLRDGNDKKRKLLNFFYSAIQNEKYYDIDKMKIFLEQLFQRDFLWNFRDIAKFNSIANAKKVFRTSSPTPYQEDNFLLEYFKINNITSIIDLRAEHEINKNPYNNDFIKNYKYIKAPFDPWSQPEWFKETQHYGTNTEIAYRFFVMACKNEVKKIFNSIYETEGAVVIHCLAGKDRTGFIIMLISLLIETSYKNMLTDYLASELDAEESKFKIYYDNIMEEGGIIKYLKSCGLNERKLATIQQKLAK
ncbi:MAG: tyrosine-protein phosphatase [Bacteroidota bacterium]|nr:tyrosine-protein phosphatase [Bacteroidota bacterium]